MRVAAMFPSSSLFFILAALWSTFRQGSSFAVTPTFYYSKSCSSTTTLYSIHDAIRELELQANNSDVVERLGLRDNFDRWRFMQKLLDYELDANDVNEVLFRVLEGYIVNNPQQPKDDEDGKDDDDDVSSPIVTHELKNTIQELLNQGSSTDGMVEALAAAESPESSTSPGNQEVLQVLETLLPDPQEDEDAFKGAWDTVIELHGRESVKVNEGKKTPQWNASCLVARVLIYYDFLAVGVMEG